MEYSYVPISETAIAETAITEATIAQTASIAQTATIKSSNSTQTPIKELGRCQLQDEKQTQNLKTGENKFFLMIPLNRCSVVNTLMSAIGSIIVGKLLNLPSHLTRLLNCRRLVYKLLRPVEIVRAFYWSTERRKNRGEIETDFLDPVPIQ